MRLKSIRISVGNFLAILGVAGAVAIGAAYFSDSHQNIEPKVGLLGDYNVVYFRQSDSGDGLLSGDRVHEIVGAQLVRSWQTVLEIHRQRPLNAIIIHADSLAAVNQQEIRELYRQGVVVAAFNVYAPPIAVLLGDECLGRNGWMDGVAEPIEGDFYLITYRLVRGTPEDVARIETQGHCSGENPASSIVNPASVRSGKAANAIQSETDLIAFAHVLLVKVEGVAEALEKD